MLEFDRTPNPIRDELAVPLVVGIGYSGIHSVGYPLISGNVDLANTGKVLRMWDSAFETGT